MHRPVFVQLDTWIESHDCGGELAAIGWDRYSVFVFELVGQRRAIALDHTVPVDNLHGELHDAVLPYDERGNGREHQSGERLAEQRSAGLGKRHD